MYAGKASTSSVATTAKAQVAAEVADTADKGGPPIISPGKGAGSTAAAIQKTSASPKAISPGVQIRILIS